MKTFLSVIAVILLFTGYFTKDEVMIWIGGITILLIILSTNKPYENNNTRNPDPA